MKYMAVENDKKKEVLKLSLEKVSLSSAGIKNKYNTLCESPSKSGKNKVFYPTLYLNSREAPDLAGSEVGKDMTVVMRVCVTRHELNERDNGKDENFTLEIKKIGVIK